MLKIIIVYLFMFYKLFVFKYIGLIPNDSIEKCWRENLITIERMCGNLGNLEETSGLLEETSGLRTGNLGTSNSLLVSKPRRNPDKYNVSYFYTSARIFSNLSSSTLMRIWNKNQENLFEIVIESIRWI